MDDKQPVSINLRPGESRRVFTGEMKRGTGFMGVPPKLDETPRSVEAKPRPDKDSKFIVKVFDKIIGFSIFALFFGLPLFFTGLTFQGIVFEKQLYFYFFLLLGLVAWAAKGVTIGEMNIRRTPLDLPIIGLWLAVLLSTIFSVDRWHSFWGAFADPSRGFMSATALVIAYYVIFSNFSAKRLNLILTAILSSGAILSVWTLLAIRNIQFLPDAIAKFAPISLIGSVIGLTVLISALIPLSTFSVLRLSGNETMPRVPKNILISALLVLLALDLFLILALYNFVPWIGLFAGVAMFLVFILSQIVRPKASWTWLPMALFVAVMILRMIGVVQLGSVNFAEVKPLDYQTSLTIAKDSLKDKMLLGSGPATYGYDFSLHRPQNFNDNIFYNLRFLQGSGAVMEALSTLGGIGAFFLIVLLLSFVSVELYLIAREKEKNKLASLGLFAAAAILVIDVTITKTEGTVLILAALIGIVSLAVALMESETQPKFLSLSLKASPKFALALAFVFMVVSAGVAFLFVFLGKIYVADLYAGAASRTPTASQDEAAIRMSRAIYYYPQESKYYNQLAQYYMFMANTETLKGNDKRDVEKIKQFLNSSISLASRSRDMEKNDVATVETLAQIYENGGLYVPDSWNLALDTYNSALALEPHNSNYYVKIGQIKLSLVASKKTEEEKKNLVIEAKDDFQKAVAEKPDLAEGFYQLSLVNDALGDRNQAIEDGTKAVTLKPTDSNYVLTLAKLYQGRGGDEDIKTAELLMKAVISANDKDVNAHFALGVLYENMKRKEDAKTEYRSVIDLLAGDQNTDIRNQLRKMIANVDAGIANTPQALGLANNQGQVAGETAGGGAQENVTP